MVAGVMGGQPIEGRRWRSAVERHPSNVKTTARRASAACFADVLRRRDVADATSPVSGSNEKTLPSENHF